jgi:hypothetical protein
MVWPKWAASTVLSGLSCGVLTSWIQAQAARRGRLKEEQFSWPTDFYASNYKKMIGLWQDRRCSDLDRAAGGLSLNQSELRRLCEWLLEDQAACHRSNGVTKPDWCSHAASRQSRGGLRPPTPVRVDRDTRYPYRQPVTSFAGQGHKRMEVPNRHSIQWIQRSCGIHGLEEHHGRRSL